MRRVAVPFMRHWRNRPMQTLSRRSFSGPMSQRLMREIGAFDWEVPIEEAWTPPASWYTWPEFFEVEKRRVFPRHWQYVGTEAQLPEPGDYFAGDLQGNGYIVVRGEDGTLRAFFNVCRHHANLLVGPSCVDPAKPFVGKAPANTFTCCYHGWQYSTDGRLTKSTRMKGIKNFRPQEFGLLPIPLTNWHGFLFLHLGSAGAYAGKKEGHKLPAEQGAAIDLHAELQPLTDQLHKHFGPGALSDMKFLKRVVFDLKANWKLFVDNYLDGEYHIPWVHPGLNSCLDMKTYRYDLFKTWSLQSASGKSGEETSADVKKGEDWSGRVGDFALYALLHPNFALNRYGEFLDINVVVPLSHDRSLIVYDYYLHKDSTMSKEEIEKALAASAQVQHEDSEVCERLQRGLSSMGYNKGRYIPSVEKAVFHFHKQLAADFLRGPDGSSPVPLTSS